VRVGQDAGGDDLARGERHCPGLAREERDENGGRAVDIEVSGAAPIVMGVPLRLERAISNLLDNAVSFSPPEGKVTAAIVGRDNWIELAICDEGPGIPPDFLPHLFERFSTRERGGLGLGLYIAKRIAMAHGGDLTVASQPGKGARFILSLLAEAK